MGAWPGPDAAFLSTLYDELAAGKLGGPISTRQQSVVGYSSGAVRFTTLPLPRFRFSECYLVLPTRAYL
jgi:hypothetical protein